METSKSIKDAASQTVQFPLCATKGPKLRSRSRYRDPSAPAAQQVRPRPYAAERQKCGGRVAIEQCQELGFTLKSPSYIRTRPRSRQFEHRKATLSKSQLVKLDVLKYLKPLHNVVVQQSRPGSECQSRFVGLWRACLQKEPRAAKALEDRARPRRNLGWAPPSLATELGNRLCHHLGFLELAEQCSRVRIYDLRSCACDRPGHDPVPSLARLRCGRFPQEVQ